MKTKLITAALLAAVFMAFPSVRINAVSRTSRGYGQGVQTDASNCPVCASDFNRQYSSLDAYALSEDNDSIILTFDQGYENGYTEKILDTLKEKNVRAIFFLTGDYAVKETDLVNRMIREGHAIGNHGMKHARFPQLSEDELTYEISALHDYVLEKYSYEMQYLRPPCGEFSEQSLLTTKKLNYKTVMWSFAYVDWNTDKQPDPTESLNRLLSASHGGAIYLLHSVSATNSTILGNLIDGIREKGYKV